MILGAFKVNFRSAGWEVPDASILISEKGTRCILGLDLQNKVRITTIQKPAPKEKSRIEVLLCEQSESWKVQVYKKN